MMTRAARIALVAGVTVPPSKTYRYDDLATLVVQFGVRFAAPPPPEPAGQQENPR